jgi:SAM-dependent methyltransferase
MAKAGERTYFKDIGQEGVDYSLHKPFAAGATTGDLLHDIAAVYSLFPDHSGKLRILDLGCGTGWTSSFYAQSGHDVIGVDISPDAIKAAKAHFGHLPSLEFICSDYDDLPYSLEFDVAVFFDSLHHAEDERVGLTAAFGALKPGGRIIVCEPGLGHAKAPASLHAVKTYGVSERDMPPKLSAKQLKKVGFSNVNTYVYPAMVHRALYRGSNGGVTRLLRSSAVMRGVTVFLLTTLARPWYGIVAATKPQMIVLHQK